MTTKPKASQLAPSVDPIVRAYIDAAVSEMAEALRFEYDNRIAANAIRTSEIERRLTDIEAQLNAIAIKVDQRFVSKRGQP